MVKVNRNGPVRRFGKRFAAGTRNGTGQDFLDLNRPVSFKILPVDWPIDRFLTGPVDRFFTEGFCSLFNACNKKFSKRGSMDEVLKFLTPDEGLRKKRKKTFAFFAKTTQFQDLLVRFWFGRHLLGSAKRAQNKRKKNWRAQTTLSDVLSYDIMRRPRKDIKIV